MQILLSDRILAADTEWGGHIRGRAGLSRPDDSSIYQLVGTGTYADGSLNFRLNNTTFINDLFQIETHYEAFVSGGDTRWKTSKLIHRYGGSFITDYIADRQTDDDRRLMDLTHALDEEDDYIIYHRIDRLFASWQPDWGSIRMGRQALTWGNGMLFNPLDLFNPFSPTDIERDYKMGDDMAVCQIPAGDTGEAQILYVSRRNPKNHDIKWDHSSVAAKFHTAFDTTEFDVMAARHYEDYVIGCGGRGYFKDAAWRMDVTWTFLEDNKNLHDYLALVANMDYSWIWAGKNFYGFIEFYHNGLGKKDYAAAMTSPAIAGRLDRGEMFTLGKTYLTGQIQMEIHSLVNVYTTVINNLHDPSGIIQPRIVWDMLQNMRCIAGANLCYGKEGSEFGGIRITGTDLVYKSADSVYARVSYYF